MRDLAITIAFAWFWLLFYGVGPLNSWAQIAAGAGALAAGCLVSGALGVVLAARRHAAGRRGRGAGVTPGRTVP